MTPLDLSLVPQPHHCQVCHRSDVRFLLQRLHRSREKSVRGHLGYPLLLLESPFAGAQMQPHEASLPMPVFASTAHSLTYKLLRAVHNDLPATVRHPLTPAPPHSHLRGRVLPLRLPSLHYAKAQYRRQRMMEGDYAWLFVRLGMGTFLRFQLTR